MGRVKVRVKIGDLFSSEAQTLVNTVNCVGVMGKGIALQFKKRYPAMFAEYADLCKAGKVNLGKPVLYRSLTGPWILNFPTKDHWKMPSDLSAIKQGLEYLESNIEEFGITSIASPPLGCGLGQLDWRSVGPVLYQGFARLNIPVELYAPPGTPDEQLSADYLSGRRTTKTVSESERPINIGLVAILETMSRILQSEYHFVGSIIFHKMVYFGTAIGLPTGLHFERDTFGPYSEHLRNNEIPILIRHELLAQERMNEAINHTLGESYNSKQWKGELQQYNDQIEKLCNLFLRIKTTDQAELYATVHYGAEQLKQQDPKVSESDVLEYVKEWKRRRRVKFTDEQISDAIRTLNILGWIDVDISDELSLPFESIIEYS